MSGNQETGSKAEQFAAEYLANAGYGIIHRNWYFIHKEIDIVASKNNTLVIVEVKSRIDKDIPAEDLISSRKLRLLVDAAEAYIEKYDIKDEVRFDIIIVTFGQGKNEIEHIENAFVPGVNW